MGGVCPFLVLSAKHQLLTLSIFLISCSNAIVFNKEVPKKTSPRSKKINSEFIGIKKNNIKIGEDYLAFNNTVGQTIEKYNLAINRSPYYLGDYRLTELKEYNTNKRFLLFAEAYNYNVGYNYIVKDTPLAYVGGFFTGTVILAPIGIPMWIAGTTRETVVSGNINFRIYIYDTYKKEVSWVSDVNYDINDVYKGDINHTNTNKAKIHDYYSTILTNKFVEEYKRGLDLVENKVN
ncbi:hypothetical protein [uncultured Ilyobacter sp.]|uniref:hypothetical protein n=1 Tax=uncultured Ilyobacter sp. TaxID=544433 RepID=UPI0029C023EC|nr:hypothetical protein [uncultured Ilyobacter sp.]